MTDRTRFGHVRQRTPLAFVPPTKGGTQAELRLYSALDSWGGEFGTSAAEFTAALDALPEGTEEIHLRVNSPGGEVYEGLAIMNALRTHPARIVAHVDGLAASAASFIVASADEVVMAPHSELMIHEAHGAAIGPADTMRSMAADLDRVSNNLASIYAERTDGDVNRWRAVMRAETWMTAEEAVASGLAERIDGQAPDADEAKKATALAALRSFTNRAHEAPSDSSTAPAAEVASPTHDGDTTQEGAAVAFSDEQLSNLRAMIGVSPDADEATIIAGLDEALSERATETPAPTNTSIPEGMAVLDEATLAQLRADAELGRQAHDAQVKAKREATVQAAVNDGRIPPARADHWRAQLAADPGAEAILNSLEKGLIGMTEVGHSEPRDEGKSDADKLYSQLYSQEA